MLEKIMALKNPMFSIDFNGPNFCQTGQFVSGSMCGSQMSPSSIFLAQMGSNTAVEEMERLWWTEISRKSSNMEVGV
jgi:hypothetical protein